MRFYLKATAALALCFTSLSAEAAVITTFDTNIPTDAYTAPTSTTGNVLVGVTGSTAGYTSPFHDTNSQYVSVESGGSATYNFGSLYSTLSFVFGSPDSYNTINLLNGSAIVGTITGSNVGAGSGSDAYFTTLASTLPFNSVAFLSTKDALEFSNVSAVSAVPLPPALPMFGAALLALGLVGYSMKRKQSDGAEAVAA